RADIDVIGTGSVIVPTRVANEDVINTTGVCGTSKRAEEHVPESRGGYMVLVTGLVTNDDVLIASSVVFATLRSQECIGGTSGVVIPCTVAEQGVVTPSAPGGLSHIRVGVKVVSPKHGVSADLVVRSAIETLGCSI